jgi:SAM-dependent methyltransferase
VAQDGYFELPDKPGFGIELDQAEIREHPPQEIFFNLCDPEWHKRRLRKVDHEEKVSSERSKERGNYSLALLSTILRLVQTCSKPARGPGATLCAMQAENYEARVAVEEELFGGDLHVHNLPPAFHYWSDKYIRPKLEAFGFSSPGGMFEAYLEAQCRDGTGQRRFVSIGAGNCDTEIGLAAHLRSRGYDGFVIDCVELNGRMLERGRVSASTGGVSRHIQFIQADFNEWTPAREYDAAIANQSLHHVLKLEQLLAGIREWLKPDGVFLVSDMIGRNGHQRWPEALAIVHELWRRLPPSYRYNIPLRRYEELYRNWECSARSFEGIRAQDILPLLLEHFHFRLCIAFGNLVDPFVDRSFGHHFDMAREWDRDFIDRVHERDEQELLSGRIKPTHLLAVLATAPGGGLRFHAPFTPEFCVRDARRTSVAADPPADPYEWGSWPHDTQQELERVCRWLKAAEDRIVEMDAAHERLHAEFVERSNWAVQLYEDLKAATALAQQRGEVADERTAWAQRRDSEVGELAGHIRRLEREADQQAEVVRRLEEQLRRVRWASRLNRYARRLLGR